MVVTGERKQLIISCDKDSLTHLPLDKMAAILADDVFKCILLIENDKIQIQI